MSHTISFVVAVGLLVPGVFMACVPMLPALSYMFVVALAYALYDRFVTLTGTQLLILLCVTAASVVVDHTAGLLGAKYGGAHTKSILWGMLGAFLGLFLLPAFGSFIGLFAGVLVAELYYKKRRQAALKAASGALIGSAVGVAVNIALSVVFLVAFVFFSLS
ncbi:MAG TPA: DUF456 domain-containing protein [Candidatus Paceibacterota bacterium]|nr:DUF456 domain-containing protein [Candidatus Paceibacterota bacterium]